MDLYLFLNSPSRQQSESLDANSSTESEPSSPEVPLSPAKKGAISVPGTGKIVEDGGNCTAFGFQDTKLIDLVLLTRRTWLNVLSPVFGNCETYFNSFMCSALKKTVEGLQKYFLPGTGLCRM